MMEPIESPAGRRGKDGDGNIVGAGPSFTLDDVDRALSESGRPLSDGGLPPMDNPFDELDDVNMPLPALATPGPVGGGNDGMPDINKLLASKKKREETSIRRLFSHDYLPPVPNAWQQTGLEWSFLCELVLKTVYFAGELEGLAMAERVHLPFSGVVEPIIRQLKDEKFVEVKGGGSGMAAQWRFQITSKGVERSMDVMKRNGYVGPCPVRLQDYVEMVYRQHQLPDISLAEIKAGFSDMVLSDNTLEKVGPAVNSGKSAFLYGPPGNGKTSICERMRDLLVGAIFVPHAIEVGGEVIKVYDAYVHEPPDNMADYEQQAGQARFDRRWIICKRPIVICGGELTLEQLDLTFNETAKYYEAPFQIKSNDGMLLIDDFGRQRVSPRNLLNRWIVPLEKAVDYLTLHTGKKVEVPFAQFVVFSTNLEPSDLVDEAFLRRLRYKIEIPNPSMEEFIEIFKRTCKGKGITYSSAMMKYLLENHYLKDKVEFRACQPRDLLDQLIDRAKYRKIKPQLTPELIDHAWASYFVKL